MFGVDENEFKREYYGNDEERNEEVDEEIEVTKRYPALRFLANCFSVIAWLIGFLTVCVTLVFISEISEEQPDTIVLGVLVTAPLLVSGAIIFALFLVAAEQIKLSIDIEENTRKQLQVLLDIKKLYESKSK